MPAIFDYESIVMKSPNPEHIYTIKTIINESPFFRHLSLTIVDIGTGYAIFEMTAQEKHLQPFRGVHGGSIAAMIDSATFWAAYFAVDAEDAGLTSIDLKLNYLAPVVSDNTIMAHGKLVKIGKTIAYATADVTDAQGKIYAHGASTLMVLPHKGLSQFYNFPAKFL